MGHDTPSVAGILNFAADRSFGGEYSNTAPELTRQNLLPVQVDIQDMRGMARKPSLDAEGFTLASHPGGAADWFDDAWIQSEYVPSCVELVKKLTGAKLAVSMHAPILRRQERERRADSPPAQFVHMDETRDAGRATAAGFAKARGITFTRGAIYNVWKAITPPPQDMPLAIGDWRTVSESDHVIGMSVEPAGPGREKPLAIPYVLLAHSAQAPDWYYVPDLSADESLVFVGVDFDPDHPLGCPHSAFVHPDQNGRLPRASLETRVIVFD